MENSKIEWTDHTMNFWYGCQHVSPGCDRCYAETMMATRYKRVQWGVGQDRRLTGDGVWQQPYKWELNARARGIRPRVFTLSLGDFFDNQVPSEWRAKAWTVISQTPNLDWLVLTKRPGNIAKMLPSNWSEGWPNVWLGCSVENQTEADRRIPLLLRIPCAVNFLSCEPLLGPLDLTKYLDLVNWCIVGGETGAKPRMMEHQWAEGVRDQCQGKTAFFMKQMTAKLPIPCDLLIRELP